MNTETRKTAPQVATAPATESLHRAFARKVTAQMGGDSPRLPAHVERNLSAARWQAVEAAVRVRRAQTASTTALATGHGSAFVNGWWVRLASCVPPLALTLGLIGIDQLNLSQRIEAAAEVDAALLADDLPPTAYADPGFAEFIRQPHKSSAP